MKRLLKEDVKRIKRNRGMLVAAAVLLVVVVAVFCLARNHAKDLRGTWVYSSNTEYDFDGRDKGAMYTGGEKYDFTYKARGKVLTVTYEDPTLETATYQFRIEGNILTLVGGEGTTGGEYQLVYLPEE